jgi:hypothetical protein
LQKFASAIPKTGFDWVEPIVEKVRRRFGFQLRQARRRDMIRHGVISTGTQARSPKLILGWGRVRRPEIKQ